MPALMNQRQPAYRNEDMREVVRDLACTLRLPGVCRSTPASEGAHLNSSWAGKGMGCKSADVVAAACHWCHTEIDNGKTLSREDREYYLMRGVILTHIALLNEGRLVLAKPRRQK